MEAALIVVIPAYNEAENLPRVLRSLRDFPLEPTPEIVVVDDGSRDATAEVAAALGARVISHPFNLGYGGAIQTGYKYALARGANLVVQMDADGQHDPRQIPRLVEAIRSGACDLAIGSRFLEDTGYEMDWTRSLGRRVLQALGRVAGVHVTDPTSGFQAMNRATLQLFVRDFFPHDYPDVDVLVVAARHGLRIREFSTRMHESPRRSTLHGGWRAIYYAYKMLLSLFAAGGTRH